MNRRIGLIALAVVLALGGAIAVYTYAHNADKRAVANTRAAHVLMVKKAVPAGTSWGDAVKGGYFSEENVPIRSTPSTAIPNLNASIPLDQVATASIATGQIVVREMFGSKSATTGILAIPKGLIAVSVTLPANADAAGFIQNGSEVAIFSTFKVQPTKKSNESVNVGGGADLYTTKTLLPRVSVIATSQDAPSDLNGGSSKNNNASSSNVLVTVAVSQADAERLVLSQQIGQLYMGLLSDNSVTTSDTGVSNLLVFTPTPIFVK